MQTSITDVSDVEVKVEVEIAAERVDREFKKQLSRLGKRANIKGFRKGKAPKSMVAKLYGSQIASDATRNLIGDTLEEAIETLERDAVGEPKVEPVLAQRGEALKYAIRIQVKPDVKVNDWEAIKVTVPPLAVDAAAVEAEIEATRKRFEELVPVEDRGADTGDVVVMNTTGSVSGEADARLATVELKTKIGAGQLVEGFEDQLIGVKPGDTVTVSVSFPDEYHAPDLASQPAEFLVEVTGVFFEELPELDDDFAQDAGYDSMEELRQGIASTQQAQAQETYDRELERALIDKVLELNPFSAPPAMIQAQLQMSARRLMFFLQRQGVPEAQASNMLNGQIGEMREQAERAVKRYLLLDAFAKAQEVEITDEEVNAEVVKRIEKAGPAGEGLFSTDEDREELRFELREKAALDLIKSRAEIAHAAPEAPSDEANEAPAKKKKAAPKKKAAAPKKAAAKKDDDKAAKKKAAPKKKASAKKADDKDEKAKPADKKKAAPKKKAAKKKADDKDGEDKAPAKKKKAASKPKAKDA